MLWDISLQDNTGTMDSIMFLINIYSTKSDNFSVGCCAMQGGILIEKITQVNKARVKLCLYTESFNISTVIAYMAKSMYY